METQTALSGAATQPDRSYSARKGGKAARVFFFIGGVLMPLGALIVESVFRLCTSVFFNPIPTPFHFAFIALVPLTILVLTSRIRAGRVIGRVLALTAGFATGISVVYAILFTPVMPLAAMYTGFSVVAMLLPASITMLPFSPLFAALILFRLMNRLGRYNLLPSRASVWLAAGGTLAVLTLTALEVPRAVARIGLERLAKDPGDVRTLNLMRTFASRDFLLSASYFDSAAAGGSSDFLAWMSNSRRMFGVRFRGTQGLTLDHARKTYFRVTGTHFATTERPSMTPGMFNWFGWDTDRGGESVGGLVPEVRLHSSTVDGSVDADQAVGYVEWTLAFKNSDTVEHEARFEVLLPEEAVVSRATLWINGEEREAAIGGRAEVRRAYQRVVRVERRDPLLVTTAGPNRILVQCFPVPPNGAEMKIKIGITTPVRFKSWSSGNMMLPVIASRNFAVPSSLATSVWIESKGALEGSELLIPERSGEVFGIRGELPLEPEAIRPNVLKVTRNRDVKEGLAPDIAPDSTDMISQTFFEEEVAPAKTLVVVLDGSSGLTRARRDLLSGIRQIPEGTKVAFIVAGDTVRVLDPAPKQVSEAVLEARIREIAAAFSSGGVDNVAALNAAWDIAVRDDGALVLWVHGDVPVEFPSTASLEQRYRRRSGGPRILSVPVTAGPNTLLQAGEVSRFVDERYDLLSASDSFGSLVRELTSPQVRISTRRTRISGAAMSSSIERKGSGHLARLAAYSEIVRHINHGQQREARAIAERYRRGLCGFHLLPALL